MVRSYRHIQVYEKEVIEIKSFIINKLSIMMKIVYNLAVRKNYPQKVFEIETYIPGKSLISGFNFL